MTQNLLRVKYEEAMGTIAFQNIKIAKLERELLALKEAKDFYYTRWRAVLEKRIQP